MGYPRRPPAQAVSRRPLGWPRFRDNVTVSSSTSDPPVVPLIPIRAGRWLGDAVEPVVSAPRYLPFPYLQEVVAAANPVIPIRLRLLFELEDPRLTSVRPQYIPQGTFPFANTYPVIPISLRKLTELDIDFQSPWSARPQYVKHSSFPFDLTYPVIPILTRRLGELSDVPRSVLPQFYQLITPALVSPLLPILTRRLEELVVEPRPIQPQFFQLIPFSEAEVAAANPVIPYMHTSWQADGGVVLHVVGPGYSTNIPFPTEEAAADFCGLYLDWIGRCRRKVRRKV